MTHQKAKQLLSAAAALAVAGVALSASAFTYNPEDLILGFRSASAYDFVVDIGPSSGFYNIPFNTNFTITAFSGAQLTSVFGSLDNLTFSVAGDVRTSGGANPFNTLWVTAPRVSLDTQSTPWNRAGTLSQGNTAGKIDGVANGAVAYSGTIPANSITNSATATVILDTWNVSGGTSYTIGMGPSGAWGSPATFQGNVENTTPAGFASSGTPLRSDLYMLVPGSGESAYLGYFELGNNGTLTYTAVPEPSGLALLGGGLLLLARFRRQNQNA